MPFATENKIQEKRNSAVTDSVIFPQTRLRRQQHSNVWYRQRKWNHFYTTIAEAMHYQSLKSIQTMVWGNLNTEVTHIADKYLEFHSICVAWKSVK